MKKLLLASTALAATAGMAAAEVSPNITLTGYAEIGIIGGDARDETQFHHDMDMNITFSAETDSGLTFGADVDLDEIDNGIPDKKGPHIVYVKGAFGSFTMGDTDGGFDWAMGEVDSLTTIDDAHTAHTGFSGNAGLDGMYDGQVLRYDYAFDSFGVAASLELDDSGDNDPIYALGAKGSFDLGGTELSLGAGYQGASYTSGVTGNGQDAMIWGVSVGFGIGGFEVALNYSDASEAPLSDVDLGDGDGFDFGLDPESGTPFDYTHYAIGVFYGWDAWGFHANYGQYDLEVSDGPGKAEASGYALAVMYELGEGISAAAGYGYSDVSVDGGGSDDTNAWSLGLVMTF
jgi:outer membrane protein OmpU